MVVKNKKQKSIVVDRLEEWFNEHVIVLGSENVDQDVLKIRTAVENAFGFENKEK